MVHADHARLQREPVLDPPQFCATRRRIDSKSPRKATTPADAPAIASRNSAAAPTAAQAIGANCTFRRDALEDIGGHACHLAEDMVTALRIHSRGWRSVYLPVVTARGLVPADMSGIFRRQLKWSTGLFQILVRDKWPWFGGLSWRQRFVYLANSTYYLTGLATAINLFLAPAFLLLGTWAVPANVEDFVAHGLPFVLASSAIYLVVQLWFQDPRERGWHWRGMILKIGSWPVFVAGMLSALLGVKVRYVPTPKTRGVGGQPALQMRCRRARFRTCLATFCAALVLSRSGCLLLPRAGHALVGRLRSLQKMLSHLLA